MINKQNMRGWLVAVGGLLMTDVVHAVNFGTDITVNDNNPGYASTALNRFGASSPTSWLGYGGAAGSFVTGSGLSAVTHAGVDSRMNILYPAGTRDPNLPDIPVLEDNEVEPGSAIGQQWDVEGLFYSTDLSGNKKFTIVGGYNFTTGEAGYYPGDIFIDTNGFIDQNDRTAVDPTDTIADRLTNDYKVTLNPYGYEYVIHFDNFTAPSPSAAVGSTVSPTPSGIANGQSYTVYQLSTSSKLISGKFGSNQHSDPFRYLTGGTVIGTGNAAILSGLTDRGVGPLATQTPFVGGTHYALTVDISAILASAGTTEFGGHVTMGCGNDDILGYRQGGTSTLPDAGSSLLLMAGTLSGLGLVARRARR